MILRGKNPAVERAEKKNCDVTAIFLDREPSSPWEERPAAKQLLAFLENQTDGETIVLVDSPRRVARELACYIHVKDVIRNVGGKLENPAFTLGAAQASHFVENISVVRQQLRDQLQH